MSSPFYFFDQFSSGSHIGGIHRSKRDANDLNQALHHVKVVLAAEDENSNKSRPTTSIPTKKRTDDKNLQKILGQFKSTTQPDVLTAELDTILQNFDEKPKITSSSSPSKSSQDTSLPKISLPSSLILRLYSTWSDLIKNTEYKYKVWRTKDGEEKWRQYVQEKRSEQIKSEKQQYINDHQLTLLHRKSSRENRTSLTNVLHQQYLTRNGQIHGSRSSARASFLSASGMAHDNLRLLKAIHQRALENATESNKNNIHVQFKLSTQIDQTAQSTQLDKQKTVVFDVPKPEVNFDKEMIILTQNKCKSLLAETKRKILATTNDHGTQHTKICRIWFYEDNQFIRNKNNLLALNEINRRPKSKFALAILRHEIPEQYNINIDIPETKSKCCIKFVDGSRQIYYPSGRLAVLCLRSPFSTTLFFDDTNVTAKQLLGLVTSTGNVLLMQPTFHARFITNNQNEYAYLCNGKTGIIEKQLRWYSTNNYSRRESPPIDEDDIHLPLYENTVQLQLNPFMQLEYNNPSNIRFAFTCQNEELKFQLGVRPPIQSPPLIDSTTPILGTKKIFGDKTCRTKRSSSICSNDIRNVLEKQQMQSQKLTDEQVDFHQLPIMRELIALRKRIRHVCDSWLQEYRTALGIMDINAYCLSDLPPPSSQPSNHLNSIENTEQSECVPILTKRASLNNDSIKSVDKQQLLRRSAKILRSNVITNSIEQFIPRSHAGQAIKQRIYTRKKKISSALPIIKSH